ncbi:MAG: OmpH family outer membrane protein [Ignavibacteria bacterium]|nr:OmpH family outer membrane protein [Ignavibacteria bacterium]
MRSYLLFILLISTVTIFAQNQQKIGYVDSQIILTQLPEAIKAQSDLDAMTSIWSNQVDSMKLALQQQYADVQKQLATMTEDQKQIKQKELIEKEQQIYAFQNKKFGQPNGEIYLKQETIFEPVKKKIYAAIEQVAKDEGMHFIFDKSGDILLLYADTSYDITFKVLDSLKRGK